MAKKGEDRPWTVKGGRPSTEALVRACLVLLGRPPVIPAEVRAAIRRDEAEHAGHVTPAPPAPDEKSSLGRRGARKSA